jgi:ABC-type transport system involved in multi-copper enzyme maturation permease subunit
VTSLLSAETRRLTARRLVWVLTLLALAGIAVSVVVVFVRSGGSDPPFRLTEIRSALLGASGSFLLLAWVIGASAIGAEWHAGTVTTELTWEPRRPRLFAAKGVALATVVFLGVLALQALLGAGLAVTAALRGTTEGADAGWLGATIAVALRSGVLAVVGAAVGFSLAFVARNTAAALGAGFAYAAIVEPLLRAWRPGWTRWLFFDNVSFFVTGEDLSFPPLGRSAAEAGLVLLLYSLLALGAALMAFRRRDVT